MIQDPRGQPLMIGESLLEQADIVRSLDDRLLALSHDLPFEETDVRRTMLNSMAAAVSGEVSILHVLHYANGLPPEQACAVFRIAEQKHLTLVGDDLMRAGRLHMLVEYQFQLENGLRHLLRSVTKATPSKFYQVAGQAAACAGLEKEVALPFLMVPAHLRNAMHANGIHHGREIATEVGGVKFVFSNGKKVEVGKLEYIVHALHHSLNVTEQIVRSPASASAGYIVDEYIEQLSEGT